MHLRKDEWSDPIGIVHAASFRNLDRVEHAQIHPSRIRGIVTDHSIIEEDSPDIVRVVEPLTFRIGAASMVLRNRSDNLSLQPSPQGQPNRNHDEESPGHY